MVDIVYILAEKSSSNQQDIFFGFLLGLISSIFAFLIQNHFKNRNKLLKEIDLLERELLEIKRMIISLNSSCDQFLEVYQLFKDKKVDSIGFPSIKNFRLKIDLSLAFQSKFSFISDDLSKVELALNSIYDGFSDVQIQETQNRLISKIIDRENALAFYTQELEFIKLSSKQLSLISENIEDILPKVSLLKTKNNNFISYFFWTIKISEEEIREQNQSYMIYKKIEDYPI